MYANTYLYLMSTHNKLNTYGQVSLAPTMNTRLFIYSLWYLDIYLEFTSY